MKIPIFIVILFCQTLNLETTKLLPIQPKLGLNRNKYVFEYNNQTRSEKGFFFYIINLIIFFIIKKLRKLFD